jgi:hypothetical protein
MQQGWLFWLLSIVVIKLLQGALASCGHLILAAAFLYPGVVLAMYKQRGFQGCNVAISGARIDKIALVVPTLIAQAVIIPYRWSELRRGARQGWLT